MFRLPDAHQSGSDWIIYPDRVDDIVPGPDGSWIIMLKTRTPEWSRLKAAGPRPRGVIVRATAEQIQAIRAAMVA